jgi:hypothetical protein
MAFLIEASISEGIGGRRAVSPLPWHAQASADSLLNHGALEFGEHVDPETWRSPPHDCDFTQRIFRPRRLWIAVAAIAAWPIPTVI